MAKQAKTYQEQIELLKSRGLTFGDEQFAYGCLMHHNYYRLSIYRFPFTPKTNRDVFFPGTTFEQIWGLYLKDRTLRQLVLEACKRVEISARARWAYEVGHRLGPLGYTDPANFSATTVHQDTLTSLQKELKRAKHEDFVRHHLVTLGMPWPPAWVVAEVASFGSVSRLVKELKDPSIRQAIADTYSLDEVNFCSILHHLSIVRNAAAHHCRLWNRRFVVLPQLPHTKPAVLVPNLDLASPPTRRIYNSLVLLMHFVICIEPAGTWPSRLVELLNTFNAALLPEMGFPVDWRTRPMWVAAGA